MHIIEVRLFELACKGDRLDEINAEEVLDRRAAAQAKARARWHSVQRRTQSWMAWITRQHRGPVVPSGADDRGTGQRNKPQLINQLDRRVF